MSDAPRCAICSEPIETAADGWPIHRHGDRSCGCGDGSEATASTHDDLLHAAWGLIANSHAWDDPTAGTPGWREAAERWRGEWHAYLSRGGKS